MPRSCAAQLEAEGLTFRGHSDTEVMLEGFERWGIAATLDRIAGMFAIALWDRHSRSLWPRPRPAGQEAALLRQDRRHLLLRLAAQELLPPSRLAGRDRSRQPHRLHALRLRARAALDLQGPCQRPPGRVRRGARRRGGGAAPLLGCARQGRSGAGRADGGPVRRGSGRALRGVAVRGGAAAADLGRAARRLPVRRRRQLGRRRPDAGQRHGARQDLQHRLRRERLRRIPACAGGGGAPGHRPSRAQGEPARGASMRSRRCPSTTTSRSPTGRRCRPIC